MYIVKINNHLMNNHLNMLPKQAKFDLKCSKMCWRPDSAGGTYDAPPDPLGGRGFTPSALATTWSSSCDSLSPQEWL